MRLRPPAPPCTGPSCVACAVAKARFLAMRQASEAVRDALAEWEDRERRGVPHPPWPYLPPGVLSPAATELWNYDPP